jgi:hypothetical protein
MKNNSVLFGSNSRVGTVGFFEGFNFEPHPEPSSSMGTDNNTDRFATIARRHLNLQISCIEQPVTIFNVFEWKAQISWTGKPAQK